MAYIKFTIVIFLALSASRLIPHPPNFTSLLALSFYVPALLGVRFLPALLISFFLTDVLIGFHNTVLFTWGSVFIIGMMSRYFVNSIIKRISGALIGAVIFFLITNFGVWTLGAYGHSINDLILCYTLAIPFFAYSLISTFLFSVVIETIYKFSNLKSVLKMKFK